MTGSRVVRCGAALAAAALAVALPVAVGMAGADTNLVGYNASALAVGAQFAFNVPNVVPLPNENLLEEDVPFARTTVGSGPVVDALGTPYYPGDIAANLGSLLTEFGAPPGVPNDTLLAESKYPTSPGFPAQATFGVPPGSAAPLQPAVFSATSDASTSGGDAMGALSGIGLANLGATPSLPLPGVSSSAGVLQVGNISATNSVKLDTGTVTATATAQVHELDVAGMVDVASLTSSATASSGGTTGTPTSSLHLGQVTVDGQAAYIDGSGVHLASTSTSSAGVTPTQLQNALDATLSQDGITITLLNPQLSTSGAQATANAGGLVITISHQIDVPFIPGEPTIPVPQLGNVGLPAGSYTATTSITFGLANANVTASGLAAEIAPLPDSSGLGTLGSATGFDSFGSSGLGGSTTSVTPSGPGSAAAAPTTLVAGTTDFPLRGIPAPIGWTITSLLACALLAYPLLLVARWQFLAGRRS